MDVASLTDQTRRMVAVEIASAVTALLAFVLSLLLGLPAFMRAGRAEERAKNAEIRAAKAEERTDRIESRDTERHDVDWRFAFRASDVSVLEITNVGADDAHRVTLIVDVDGERIYLERPLVLGRGLQIVDAEFPFLVAESVRTARESQVLAMQTHGLGSVVLAVTVTLRVHWFTALGAVRAVNSGPRRFELP